MDYNKQVDKSHYVFKQYMHKPRWISLWHQLDEIHNLNPSNVLEVGPGPGLLKSVAAAFGLTVETLDIDPDLKPDHVASATKMPFSDSTYDVVCAFQMLEHLKYESSLDVFGEMVRVSKRYLVISLPDARPTWRYQVHIPKYGSYDLLMQRPLFRAQVHKFDGEHYWEINKIGYPLQKIMVDFTKGVRLLKTYRVRENPYHRFFVLEKC